MRRKTDHPAERELKLLTENHLLGARVLEMERAIAALELDRSLICDALNRWARRERIEPAAAPSEIKGLIDRLYKRFSGTLEENRAKCLELAEMAGEIRDLRRDYAAATERETILQQRVWELEGRRGGQE